MPERESMQFSPLHERYLVSLLEFVVLQPYDSGDPLAWG